MVIFSPYPHDNNYPFLIFRHLTGRCACVPGTRVGKKDYVLSVLGICTLVTDCCFWLGAANTGGQPLLLNLPLSFMPRPLWPKWLPENLNGQCPFIPMYICMYVWFYFFLFEEQPLKLRALKNNFICKGIRKCIPIQRFRKLLRRYYIYTSGRFLTQWQTKTIKRKTNNKSINMSNYKM